MPPPRASSAGVWGLFRLRADAGIRFVVPDMATRYRGPPKMTMDLFIHLTATAIDGASWMLAFGHSIGTLPGR